MNRGRHSPRTLHQDGDGNGNLEVLGMAILTGEVGAQPLFSGIRRLPVSGFESDREIVIRLEPSE